ncbi:hypothetical protein LCGC14_2532000, partial [marine sediment metagenome]
GHYSPASWPINRSPERRGGFGYAYHDANYLMLSDNKPYMVYLGRRRDPELMTRANFDNRIDSRRVPNEIIYYQIIANKFRGTLRRVRAGQIVRFTLRDFKVKDLDECVSIIGPFGGHEQIWHGSEADIAANEYIRKKVHVRAVKAIAGGDMEITLGIEQDAFVPFLLTPLPLTIPKAAGVKAATVQGVACPIVSRDESTYVDVPLQAALRSGCRMTAKMASPDMTVPDRMEITLTIQNTSAKPITAARLRWVGEVGFAVSGGDGAPFDVPPGGSKVIKATAATTKGARFGIVPFAAVVTAKHGGGERVFMESFEAVVAPRLRVEMDPMQQIPMVPGRTQHFFVHIDNMKSSSPGGPANTFISHRAGPCSGTISLDLPNTMTAEPAEQAFELAENGSKTLIFKVTNTAWADEPTMVRPLIRFKGESQPLQVLFPGTTVTRNRQMLKKPFVQRAMIGKFERTHGMSHALYGIFLTMGKIISGVNTPLIP